MKSLFKINRIKLIISLSGSKEVLNLDNIDSIYLGDDFVIEVFNNTLFILEIVSFFFIKDTLIINWLNKKIDDSVKNFV